MMNTSTSPTGAIAVVMSRGGFDEAIFKSIQEEVYPSSLEVHKWHEWDYYQDTTVLSPKGEKVVGL